MIPLIFTDSDVKSLISLYEKNNSSIFDIEEFKEDMMRFMYIYRILKRYSDTGILNHRLILNHVIILYNVFGSGVLEFLLKGCPDDSFPDLCSVIHCIERLPIQYHSSVNDMTLDLLNSSMKALEYEEI